MPTARGTDWPNCWPPAQPFSLGVDRGSVVLDLPVADELPSLTHEFVPGPGPSNGDADVVDACVRLFRVDNFQFAARLT